MSLAPVPIAIALFAVAAYVAGVRRVVRSGQGWPWRRTLSFLGAGVPLFLVATCGPPAAQAHQSLFAYMVMVVILGLITPIFWVWGAPVSLGRAVLPPAAARCWGAWWDSHVVRVLTYPMVAPLLLIAMPVLILATPLLLLSLQNRAVFALVQLALLFVGLLATLPLSDRESPDHRVPHPVGVFLAFFELVLDAVPGIVLTYTTTLVAAGWYVVNGIPGGTEWAAGDQRAAGMTLWIVAELVDLPFLFLMIRRWIKADAEDARRIDAELDAQDARAAEVKAARDRSDRDSLR